jgi:transposase
MNTGKIVREVKVGTEPDALLAVLKNPAYRFKRIGLEAGPLSQWLYSALAAAELPVVCVETRHMPAVLKAQINKNRKLLQSKAIAIENDLRSTLRNLGLQVGIAGSSKFEARIKELVDNLPDLAALVELLLTVRRVLREQIGILRSPFAGGCAR